MQPDDLGRAGRGDTAALRRLRDYWLELADGETVNPLLPHGEVLPQLELLAELAASGSDDADDWIALLVAYQLRVETLQRDAIASQALAKQAVEANDLDKLDRWTRAEVEFTDRRGHYRLKMDALLANILGSDSAEGTAMLVAALTIQADSGDDRAVGMLQCVMDSVTPERAAAILSHAKKIERESAQ